MNVVIVVVAVVVRSWLSCDCQVVVVVIVHC